MIKMGMKKLFLMLALCLLLAIPALAAFGGLTNSNGISTTGNAQHADTADVATITLTDANLTGVITSNGNATTTAAQTGAGSTFVMADSTTGAMAIPGGNMSQRPICTGVPGQVRWNTSLPGIEVCDGTTWGTFATVAFTGSYSDLTNKPALVQAYEGTTQRLGAFPIFKSGTVSSGTTVLNFTADGTSGGTALCTNGIIQDSINVTVNDSAAAYQAGWVLSNSNKTITITSNKATSTGVIALLGISLLSAPVFANGATVKLSAWCY